MLALLIGVVVAEIPFQYEEYYFWRQVEETRAQFEALARNAPDDDTPQPQQPENWSSPQKGLITFTVAVSRDYFSVSRSRPMFNWWLYYTGNKDGGSFLIND